VSSFHLAYNKRMKFQKGFVKNKDYKTYYEVYGELNENTIPLIILHGGPGGTFSSYEVFTKLVDKGFTIVFYNQHGSGSSKIINHNNDIYFFETYYAEFESLIEELKINKYSILGHSWGGMLALKYIIDRDPTKLVSLILYSSLPSSKLWNEESLRLINYYPHEYKLALLNNLNHLKYNKKIYKKAVKLYTLDHHHDNAYKVYKPLHKRKMKFNKEVYEALWGDSELFCTGSLLNYDVINDLDKVKIPTLIINGANDESTPYINKVMHDGIKNSKWFIIQDARHVSYNEHPEEVINILNDWLRCYTN